MEEEDKFEEISNELDTLLELARPLMKYLADNYDPHHYITVENDRVAVVGEEKSVISNEFIKG